MIMNHEDMTCIPDKRIPSISITGHLIGHALCIQTNPFDPHIYLILESTFCEVIYFTYRELVHSNKGPLVRLVNDRESHYQGAKFLSARTLLTWTVTGESDLIFLGDQNELKRCACSELSPQSIVLISNGVDAIYVDHLSLGSYGTYQYSEI